MNQVKDDLYLNEDGHQVIIGKHARERIAERLSWSKKVYKQVIREVCLEFWDDIVDNDTNAIHVINKGAEWIFETRGPNRIVLMTVILCNKHPNHVTIRKLIKAFCSTGDKNLKDKMECHIKYLDKKTPKLVTLIDSNGKKIYSTFSINKGEEKNVG